MERGKVSNKLRFAIYKRDGYRCRYCHKSQSSTLLEANIELLKKKDVLIKFSEIIEKLCMVC